MAPMAEEKVSRISVESQILADFFPTTLVMPLQEPNDLAPGVSWNLRPLPEAFDYLYRADWGLGPEEEAEQPKCHLRLLAMTLDGRWM